MKAYEVTIVITGSMLENTSMQDRLVEDAAFELAKKLDTQGGSAGDSACDVQIRTVRGGTKSVDAQLNQLAVSLKKETDKLGVAIAQQGAEV